MRLVGTLESIAEINRVVRAAIHVAHEQSHDIDAKIF
jgi:hypothetical protein